MIRINLLRGERKKGRRAIGVPITLSDTVKQLGFLAVVLLALAIGAFLWFDISGKINDLTNDLRDAESRRSELKEVKELVDKLDVERGRLEERLEVLTDLKRNLRTPLYSLFFIYQAQRNSTGIILTNMKEADSEAPGLIKLVISGESSTAENLNSFLDLLSEGRIVSSIDIVNVSSEKFEVHVFFQTLNSLSEEQGTASEDEEGTARSGKG